MKTTKSAFLKVAALCLVIALLLPTTVFATGDDTMSPYASYYLDEYNTYICRIGSSGEIQIWFTVMGTGDMDEIGVLSIVLYESSDNKNWKHVDSFLHEDYDTMLIKDDFCHSSYVSYQGSVSKTYKAYVCFWAGKNGGGDTRYMWSTMA